MEKKSKKIISITLIIMLLMPTFLVFAEEVNYEHEYKLEEYLMEEYYIDEMTDENLADITNLSMYDYNKSNYLDYEDYNMVNLNLEILPKLINLKSIYISYSGLKSFDMNLISNLTKLESLILDTDSLKEIKNLNSEELLNLRSLKEIKIKIDNDNIKSIDLNKIANLEKIENIEISSNSITHISIKGTQNQNKNSLNLKIDCPMLKEIDIDTLSNLKKLSINEECYTQEYELNNIKFSNLSNLTELDIKTEKLSIKEISDSINANNMPQLESLNFEMSEIEDEKENLDIFEILNINSFKELKNLELIVFDPKISKLNVIESVQKLEKLYIIYSQITEITNLDKIENLNTLFINANITEIILPETILIFEAFECDELVNIKLNENLESIALYYCDKIEELEITEKFKRLENLEINSYRFKQLILPEDTSKLENLKTLNIYMNQLNDIKYPENLESITINCSNNELTIPEYLNKLNYLYISDYELTQLNLPEDKNKLSSLQELCVYSENLNNVNYPNNLKSLQIDCDNHELTISENLGELEYLYISDYELTQLNLPEDRNKLENLQDLYIYCEKLDDINYPNNLKRIDINCNNEELMIPDNLTKLEYLQIYAYDMIRLNLPEDKNKLESLKDLDIICKELNNDVNLPNNIEDIYISSENTKEITISENLNKLEFLNISANNLEKLNLPEDTKKLESIIGIHIYNCKRINEINYPDNLFSFSINSRENETISIDDNATRLYSIDISGDKIKEINLPEDTSKLENLNDLYLNCEKINNINYPNNLKELKITASKATNINLPTNTTTLKKVEIKAEEASVNIENLKEYNMDGVSVICKSLQGNCIDKLTNLKGLKLFAQEDFDTSLISNLNELQYLALNKNYKPGNNDESDDNTNNSSNLTYNKKPLCVNSITTDINYIYGFTFYNGESNDTKADFIEKFDYSKLVEENDIVNPNIKIVNTSDEELADNVIVGTGHKIKIFDGEELKFEYSIVYYGDVDGDGKWTAIDSLAIIKNNFTKNGYTLEQPFTFADEIFEEAGRIITESGKVPGAMDALAIVKQSFGTYTINQYKNKITSEE